MAKGDRFAMRTKDEFMKEIDEWRREQPAIPTRAESVRALARIGLRLQREAAQAGRSGNEA